MWNFVSKTIDAILDGKKQLEGKVTAIYYAGGTLCLDFINGGGIGLNLDGKGFSYRSGKIYVPKTITEKVRKLYLKKRGYTSHFSKSITGNMGNV